MGVKADVALTIMKIKNGGKRHADIDARKIDGTS
jgi:hypothetical protein